MKTDDLVALLARGPLEPAPDAAARRYGAGLAIGALLAAGLMVVELGVRADLAVAMRWPMFWVKGAYVAALAIAGLFVALRLSRPGRSLGWTPAWVAAPLLAMWLLAGAQLWQASPDQRSVLFYGDTWESCPWLIALLSTPVFVGVFWAMRGLAPTRLRLAGGAAGWLAGCTGALVYCLHCPELQAPFLGFWYLLGMLIPAVAGVWLGPRLLRW